MRSDYENVFFTAIHGSAEDHSCRLRVMQVWCDPGLQPVKF